MNPNNLIEFAHKGFRVTIGAATAFVETLQDPQQRTETLSEMTAELNEKIQAWAAKGELTEQEARRMVEEMLARQETPTGEKTAPQESPPSSTVNAELQELTARVAALRLELEQLRKSNQD
ncbi:hypothetical protein IQ249_18090 [Lusitaniella coriacea LEGE 07157]|uniref:Uncharacterized protein n=1 Tax=Lusitaniella coriacea LEGE 07157 TaxID=945747 RepID=A0A8J7E059_9CYAN|nr:hypothetical protein [Lusitaniella coriacea]MBE9117813.1 hypothetical protein [Lusitaniella coriacea LEGE 07157]